MNYVDLRLTPAQRISNDIWDLKYRLRNFAGDSIDRTIDDTFKRVAHALAETETSKKRKGIEEKFFDVLTSRKFLPAGRILCGAGTGRDVTLFNCLMMATIPDSIDGIFEQVKRAALTMKQGGGIGMNFSSIRPKGEEVKGLATDASGPLSFMSVWDSMCRSIMSAGTRRGAMMGTLECSHPDIEAFVEAKRNPEAFRMFNLSVLITDDFMRAVSLNAPWVLHFQGRNHKTIRAVDLWNRIMRATYDAAEPGVIFIDRMNKMNNLYYCEEIFGTNPCSEQPLPRNGACLLGSINLPMFIADAFSPTASLLVDELGRVVRLAVRMLDDVFDASNFALPEQREEAFAKRRMGLGIMGLADALAMLRLHYGTAEARKTASSIMRTITYSAYQASADLGRERGSFPLFDQDKYLTSAFIQQHAPIQHMIADAGAMRNSNVTSIAPTGTISLFAGNVSGGCEPIFNYEYQRKVLMPDGTKEEVDCEDYAVGLFKDKFPGEDLPDYFVTAKELSPEQHVAMMAALQPFVDSSISKTVNCPADISFEAFEGVYLDAYEKGCKSIATFRPNSITGSVLSDGSEKPADSTAQNHSAQKLPEAVPAILPPRPDVLSGRTYKLKVFADSPAIYVTINHTEDNRPYEIFINTKDMEHFAWVVALTRMISAIWRRGGDVAFVTDELKVMFDPRGGFWHGGKHVPSTVAAIGDIIERHMLSIGFYEAPLEAKEVALASVTVVAKSCPRCSLPAFRRTGDCSECAECGYTKCD